MNTDQIYDVIEMLVPLTGQALDSLGEESPLCKLLLSHLELMLDIQKLMALGADIREIAENAQNGTATQRS